jgi:acyl-CoA oxidase
MSIFEKARNLSKVNTLELEKLVFGSHARAEELRTISKELEKISPPTEAAKFPELDRVSQIKHAYKVFSEMIRLKRIKLPRANEDWELYYLNGFELPGGVSNLMVIPLIETLCSEEQKNKWLPLFDTSFVIGSYAQTELGHGSDVQSLETEAVFDEKTKEFVIHTPKVSAIKWWPGELSNLCNVAIVFAKLIVKGKKIGVFPFIVQIRDFKTHQPLPGVEVGDIGPKLGYSAKENGFLRFDHFHVPLANLPSRFIEISPQGDVTQKGDKKIIYSSMMKSRTALLNCSADCLGKGVAIAIRYSHLRKQFKNDRKEEVPIIQYQLQQFKLFPLLAKCYAMITSYRKVMQFVKICNTEVENGNFQNLQEMHVILSGSKAMFTWWCINGLVTCMQCCGGHGYSQYSGIPNIIQNTFPNTILEGENTVLCLQVGRFLLKCYRQIIEGKGDKVNGYCKYLKKGDELGAFNANFSEDVTNLSVMKTLWQKAVFMRLTDTVELITEEMSKASVTEVFNKKAGVHVFEVAKLHSVLFTFDYFMQYISEVTHHETKEALTLLAKLFITDLTLEYSALMVLAGAINSSQIRDLQKHFEKLLEELTKDCLKLAEGFVVSDYSLHSAIAHSNEKPYENLYNLARSSGMINRTDMVKPYLDILRAASIETFGKPKL